MRLLVLCDGQRTNRRVVRAFLTLALVAAAASGGAQRPPRSHVSPNGVVTTSTDRPVPDPRRIVAGEILVRLKQGTSPDAERRALDAVALRSVRTYHFVE